MTALTKASSVKSQELHQVHAANYARDLTQFIHDSPTKFPAALSNLVIQYLIHIYTPSTSAWTAQWAGGLGREVCTKTIVEVNISLNRIPEEPAPRTPFDLVNLVVEYLQVQIFGLKDLEEAAGGREVLAKLLPGYGPERPLPAQIDDEIQTDLSTVFSPKALVGITAKKVGEFYFYCWGPKNRTANISNAITKNAPQNSTKFHKDSWEKAIEELGDTLAPEEGWIQFPYEVMGRGKPFEELEALMPKNYEVSHFYDAVYAAQMYYVFTGERILSDKPKTYALCQELVAVGNFAGGLLVTFQTGDGKGDGVAFARKFC